MPLFVTHRDVWALGEFGEDSMGIFAQEEFFLQKIPSLKGSIGVCTRVCGLRPLSSMGMHPRPLAVLCRGVRVNQW